MSTLVINYELLMSISGYASNVAKRTEDYADDLSKKVSKKIGNLSGGATNNTSSAQYFVDAKIRLLENKKEAFNKFSGKIKALAENAKKVDEDVADAISDNKEKFLKNNEHLRIDEWKSGLLEWLIDLKNKCPLFNMIGNIINNIGAAVSDALANIKYWYKCEGGKEILAFVVAIGGAVIAIALFIVSLPASGFVAVCAAIGAAITAVNAVANVATSFCSMIFANLDDPAWARIYGKQDTLSDWLRGFNFKSKFWNRFSYGFATTVDGVALFCDIVNIVNFVKTIKTKFSFINNYFSKDRGLFSYFKTVKWKAVDGKMVMDVDKHGIVKTKFTVKSVWRGIKAFVMDKPIASYSDVGIRTLHNRNFKIDISDWRKSFSWQGLKDTFKYKVTDGGRISFAEWKNTIFTINKNGKLRLDYQNIISTIKYNIKSGNNAFSDMFNDKLAWKKRQDAIKTTVNSLKSINSVSTKIGNVIIGEYDISKEISDYFSDKIKNFSDFSKLAQKIDKLKKKIGTFKDNTYYSKYKEFYNEA